MIRHPVGQSAGQVSDELVYTLDVPATVLAAADVQPIGEIEGQNLLQLMGDGDEFVSRDYLTCRYGNSVWYKDDQTWFFSTIDFQQPRLFDLEKDPDCQHNIAAEASRRFEVAKTRIMTDAAGKLRRYMRQNSTDAIGRPIFEG